MLQVKNEEYFMFMNRLLPIGVLIIDKMSLFLFVTHGANIDGYPRCPKPCAQLWAEQREGSFLEGIVAQKWKWTAPN